MAPREPEEKGRVPPVGPLSGRQTGLLLRASGLATVSGLAAAIGLLVAMILADDPGLLDYWFWVTVFWVLPPASLATYLDGKLPDDVAWTWEFLVRGRRPNS